MAKYEIRRLYFDAVELTGDSKSLSSQDGLRFSASEGCVAIADARTGRVVGKAPRAKGIADAIMDAIRSGAGAYVERFDITDGRLSVVAAYRAEAAPDPFRNVNTWAAARGY